MGKTDSLIKLWDSFVDSLARRGGQNLILWVLTILFSFMVAWKKLPPEMTLTPVITGMMAFMTHTPGQQDPKSNGN